MTMLFIGPLSAVIAGIFAILDYACLLYTSSSSDYSHLEELVDFLMDTCEQKKVNISIPSLRIGAFSLDVMGEVQDVKKSSLTFEMSIRDRINCVKICSWEDIVMNTSNITNYKPKDFAELLGDSVKTL